MPVRSSLPEKKYIQVTESMNDPVTRERVLSPFRSIRDNYEKVVIAGDCDHPVTQDGIMIVKLADFLLDG